VLVTLVAFLAGIVSVLTPCVLPLLPALLAVSGTGERRRVTGLVLGIIVSLSVGLVALTALLSAAGTVGTGLRWVAVGLLTAIGVLFLVPAAKDRVEATTSRVISRIRPRAADATATGFGGGLLTGLALGVVWTPCAGPVLAAVAVAAAQDDLGPRSLISLSAFALGMAIALTILALGGRRAGFWLRTRLGGRRLDVATGVVLITTAGLIASGLDVTLNRWVAQNTTLGTTITADLEAAALSGADRPADAMERAATDLSPAALEADGYPELDDLADLGPAPMASGLGPWFNTADSQPLTAEDLDGKVVLIDFWTYSCINCLRTLPHLSAWHESYSDDGLVIVGVHAPEFAFESVPGNVEQAIDDLGVTWPVALDNSYETWDAFHNRYWPAKYLIDRDGTLRYVHYGEGAYSRTERHVQTLLGTSATISSDGVVEAARTDGQTPETYLGYERGRRFGGTLADDPATVVRPDEPAVYGGPEGLDRDIWTLVGEWTVQGERSVAGRDAELWVHYYARDVFVVMGDTDEDRASAPSVVSDDRGPGGRQIRHVLDTQRLYILRDSDEPVDGLVRVQVPPGVAVYAFTFG